MINSSKLIFREASQDDLTDIVRLLTEDELGQTREIGVVDEAYQAIYDEIISDKNQALMVVEYDGQIVGTCHLNVMASLTFHGTKRLNIEAVRVDKSLRGQSVGEWMIQQAIEYGKKNGCKLVQLATNKQRHDAIRFYKRLGFDETHFGMKMYL